MTHAHSSREAEPTDTKENNPVFCPIPWSYVFAATDGALLSCVIAASTESKGLVLDEQGKAMRAGETSLEEFRNSRPLKELRRNMLEGKETPAVCRRCIDEEKFGLVSRRKLENRKKFISASQARQHTRQDGHINTEALPVACFNLRLGNYCNLACGICGPSQSSGWYEEWFRVRHAGFHFNHTRHRLALNEGGKVFLENSPFFWHRNPSFWEEVARNSVGLKEFHFSGGEPFLSVAHIKFLEELVERGLSKDLSLEYNSNLTVLPERLLGIWPHFRKVSIGVSIDAVGAMNDYLRYPGKFEQIQANLKILDELPSHVTYWSTQTISNLSVGGFPALVKWIAQSGLKRINRAADGGAFFLSYHMLRKPENRSVRALPPRAKKVVRERFERFLFTESAASLGLAEAEMESLRHTFFSILNHMNSEDKSSLCASFLEEERKSSDFRKTSFSAVDPEIWESLVGHAEQSEINGSGPIPGA